jgi:tyrosine-protein phosphatase SIW14
MYLLQIKRGVFLGIVLGLVWVAASLASAPAAQDLPNFGRVSDGLYRGAQPSEDGVKRLRQLGIKSIINLREPNDAWPAEALQVLNSGMVYTNVPMSGRRRPTDRQVASVLSLIETLPKPVFIHCKRGADRTGTVVACYRVKHDHWTSEAALHEARHYGMSGWVWGMKRFVEDFAQKVHVLAD